VYSPPFAPSVFIAVPLVRELVLIACMAQLPG
jgi:hypothetical protein